MDKLADFIVNNRRKIGIVFCILTIISIILIPQVKINYDLSKYIPSYAPAKEALDIVEEEFGMQSIARLMINDVSIVEAKEYKEKIEKIDGVNMVVWLDSSYDVYQPETFMDSDTVKDYYKDGSALFTIMFDEDDYSQKTYNAISEIEKIVPADFNMMGSGVDTKSTQDNITSEIIVIMAMLIPLTIVILLLTTTSWFSSVLFITVISISIILNMGTNVIFDSVSFLTFSISAALQFAVSMDYSVFMLHQFEIEKEKNKDIREAMKKALKHSIISILSSSMTTVVGFLALAFMSFKIGADIGFVFSKGIVLSLICVIFFMPYLILKYNNIIEKSSHRSFLPSFGKLGNALRKARWIIIILVILIVVPSFVAQKQNQFLYGVGAFGSGEGTKSYIDEKKIIEKFGRSNPMVILVPNRNYVDEKLMVQELENISTISEVQTLANTVPEGVPYSFIDKELYDKFQNEKYTRIIVYSKTSSESELATNTLNDVKQITEKYYDNEYKITGTIPITIDMKNVIESDYGRVNAISILAILVILLFTFKNLPLALLLVGVIESGIFINMSVPYFTGSSMIFMGYLIVSSIELGATIDYAILTTDNYLAARKTMDKFGSMVETIKKSTPAIITSGGILITAGYLIKFGSSLTAVSDMGELIGRGALISLLLVVIVLPQLLVIFDKIIHMSIIPKGIREKLSERRKERFNRYKNSGAYKKRLEIIRKVRERNKTKEENRILKKQKKIDKKIEKLMKKREEI